MKGLARLDISPEIIFEQVHEFMMAHDPIYEFVSARSAQPSRHSVAVIAPFNPTRTTESTQRFTHRARRVLSLAQEEAERLNHPVIDTGHLLRGLLRDKSGIAGNVLRDLGTTRENLEPILLELRPAGTEELQKTPVLTEEIKQALDLALDEVGRMGHKLIGTEHLLLGLMRQSDTPAIQALARLGISPEEVRRAIQRILDQSPISGMGQKTNPSVVQSPAEVTYQQQVAAPLMQYLVDSLQNNRLTLEQVRDLLGIFVPEVLSPPEKVGLLREFFHLSGLGGRELEVTIRDNQTQALDAQFVLRLDEVLNMIERILRQMPSLPGVLMLEFKEGSRTVQIRTGAPPDQPA
jgi:ATP-dependent Clp protease ATP-binding subunit ClpA